MVEFKKLLSERWSCRAYLPDPVPDAEMREMFAIAQRTASWCNTQPWQVFVTAGEATRRFGAGLTEHARTHTPEPDLAAPEGYYGIYLDRRRECGFALYEALGIARDDKAARAEQSLKNFDFFGAPHVAVITTDRDQATYGAIDCGGYVANLINAATSLGIATIPQAAIAMHSPYVREHFALPDDRLVVCAVSFGYADLEHPANGFRTTRAEVDDAITVVTD